jgi:hypothetical protein
MMLAAADCTQRVRIGLRTALIALCVDAHSDCLLQALVHARPTVRTADCFALFNDAISVLYGNNHQLMFFTD